MPKYVILRKEIMKECHDMRWVGHLDMYHILAFLKYRYYWPHVGDGIKTYVKNCLVCQQDKVKLKSPTGLL